MENLVKYFETDSEVKQLFSTHQLRTIIDILKECEKRDIQIIPKIGMEQGIAYLEWGDKYYPHLAIDIEQKKKKYNFECWATADKMYEEAADDYQFVFEKLEKVLRWKR